MAKNKPNPPDNDEEASIRCRVGRSLKDQFDAACTESEISQQDAASALIALFSAANPEARHTLIRFANAAYDPSITEAIMATVLGMTYQRNRDKGVITEETGRILRRLIGPDKLYEPDARVEVAEGRVSHLPDLADDRKRRRAPNAGGRLGNQ